MSKTRIHANAIAICGVMSAVGVVLAFLIHIPLIPAVNFLEYDPADVVVFICTYAFGVPVGLAVTLVVSVIQGITVSASGGIIGIASHFVGTGSYVLAAGLVYQALQKVKKNRQWLRLGGATGAGILVMIAVMALWNVWLTPVFMKVPREIVVRDYLPLILLFNVIRAGINGVASAVLTLLIKPILKKMAGNSLIP